jgi:hypothetical protein
MNGHVQSVGWTLAGLVCAVIFTLIFGRRAKGSWPSSRREDVRDLTRVFSGPCRPVYPEDEEGA